MNMIRFSQGVPQNGAPFLYLCIDKQVYYEVQRKRKNYNK